MKRWAALTVLLYALALMALTVPVLLIAFGGWAKNGIGLQDALKFYSYWEYWLWLAVLVAGQALLLLLPIDISERRLPARRPLKVPVIISAFLLANLCFAGIFSILCAIFTDGAFKIFDFLPHFFFNVANSANQIISPHPATTPDWQSNLNLILIMLVFWSVWAIIFRRATKSDEPDALLKRITRWLLRGSILELLVAVPSHIIVRRREDCCAPAGTFWGIATGVSIMLLCFGPGVFFLFVERFKRLQPKAAETDKKD
jgi:hypothetical protein